MKKLVAFTAVVIVLAMSMQADARCRRCRKGGCCAAPAAAPACTACK